jgi:hypothetical protein
MSQPHFVGQVQPVHHFPHQFHVKSVSLPLTVDERIRPFLPRILIDEWTLRRVSFPETARSRYLAAETRKDHAQKDNHMVSKTHHLAKVKNIFEKTIQRRKNVLSAC